MNEKIKSLVDTLEIASCELMDEINDCNNSSRARRRQDAARAALVAAIEALEQERDGARKAAAAWKYKAIEGRTRARLYMSYGFDCELGEKLYIQYCAEGSLARRQERRQERQP